MRRATRNRPAMAPVNGLLTLSMTRCRHMRGNLGTLNQRNQLRLAPRMQRILIPSPFDIFEFTAKNPFLTRQVSRHGGTKLGNISRKYIAILKHLLSSSSPSLKDTSIVASESCMPALIRDG